MTRIVPMNVATGPFTFKTTSDFKKDDNGVMSVVLELVELRLTKEEFEKLPSDAQETCAPLIRIVGISELNPA